MDNSCVVNANNPSMLKYCSFFDTVRCACDRMLRCSIIPSEARLYSGSVDLFRGRGRGHGHGHGPPSYPATSLAIAYQTRSERLPSL